MPHLYETNKEMVPAFIMLSLDDNTEICNDKKFCTVEWDGGYNRV